MNEISTYSENVKTRTIRIKTIQDNVCQGMIEIGKELIEIKKEIDGKFEQYIKDELNYSRRTAYNLIRVANDFSNVQTFAHLTSSKVFALLDLPSDSREEFIKQSNIEDSTVRQLKEEIKKYKEENGLLSKKQKQALDEKRRIESEKQRLLQQLQQEKNKKHIVETKIEYKEKVIDKTDYSLKSKLDEYERKINSYQNKIKLLEEGTGVKDELIESYKQEIEEYTRFKERMNRLNCISGGDYDEVKAFDDVNNLYLNIRKLIKEDLAPVRYEDGLRFINTSEYITQSFIEMIDVVQIWCDEMRSKLSKENNIITVEVEWKWDFLKMKELKLLKMN